MQPDRARAIEAARVGEAAGGGKQIGRATRRHPPELTPQEKKIFKLLVDAGDGLPMKSLEACKTGNRRGSEGTSRNTLLDFRKKFRPLGFLSTPCDRGSHWKITPAGRMALGPQLGLESAHWPQARKPPSHSIRSRQHVQTARGAADHVRSAIEPPIRLDEVPARVPWLAATRPGKKLSFSTLWRWATKGIRGIRLEVLHGRHTVHFRGSIKRFFGKIAARPAQPGRADAGAVRTHRGSTCRGGGGPAGNSVTKIGRPSLGGATAAATDGTGAAKRTVGTKPYPITSSLFKRIPTARPRCRVARPGFTSRQMGVDRADE